MWEAVTGTLGIEDWGVVRAWKPGRIPRGANYEVEMRWQDIYRVTLGSVTLEGKGGAGCGAVPRAPASLAERREAQKSLESSPNWDKRTGGPRTEGCGPEGSSPS